MIGRFECPDQRPRSSRSVAEQPALVIACDASATSAGTYQSDTVLDSAEDPQPATRRQVARELVPEVRARDGREGDVARGYKSDYFVGLIRTFKNGHHPF